MKSNVDESSATFCSCLMDKVKRVEAVSPGLNHFQVSVHHQHDAKSRDVEKSFSLGSPHTDTVPTRQLSFKCSNVMKMLLFCKERAQAAAGCQHVIESVCEMLTK